MRRMDKAKVATRKRMHNKLGRARWSGCGLECCKVVSGDDSSVETGYLATLSTDADESDEKTSVLRNLKKAVGSHLMQAAVCKLSKVKTRCVRFVFIRSDQLTMGRCNNELAQPSGKHNCCLHQG